MSGSEYIEYNGAGGGEEKEEEEEIDDSGLDVRVGADVHREHGRVECCWLLRQNLRSLRCRNEYPRYKVSDEYSRYSRCRNILATRGVGISSLLGVSEYPR